jgi:hypothetical protein
MMRDDDKMDLIFFNFFGLHLHKVKRDYLQIDRQYDMCVLWVPP